MLLNVAHLYTDQAIRLLRLEPATSCETSMVTSRQWWVYLMKNAINGCLL